MALLELCGSSLEDFGHRKDQNEIDTEEFINANLSNPMNLMMPPFSNVSTWMKNLGITLRRHLSPQGGRGAKIPSPLPSPQQKFIGMRLMRGSKNKEFLKILIFTTLNTLFT